MEIPVDLFFLTYRNVDFIHSNAMETLVMVCSTISALMCSVRCSCRVDSTIWVPPTRRSYLDFWRSVVMMTTVAEVSN